jgi:segregation and condensation protein B
VEEHQHEAAEETVIALDEAASEPREEPGADGPAEIPAEGSAETSEDGTDTDEASDRSPAVGAQIEEPEQAVEGESTGTPEASEEEAEEAAGPGPGDDLSDEELERRLTALLFASPDPLSVPRLVSLLERPRPARVKEALEALTERLAAAALPLEPREIAGGWRLFTTSDQAETVLRLSKARKSERISPAALETLSIVAYRQPVTKAEIEAIRGVQSGPILRTLVDRGLVKVAGRADQPGAPLVYGTTKAFLDRFGLASLGELPRDAELAKD